MLARPCATSRCLYNVPQESLQLEPRKTKWIQLLIHIVQTRIFIDESKCISGRKFWFESTLPNDICSYGRVSYAFHEKSRNCVQIYINFHQSTNLLQLQYKSWRAWFPVRQLLRRVADLRRPICDIARKCHVTRVLLYSFIHKSMYPLPLSFIHRNIIIVHDATIATKVFGAIC